MLSEQKANFDLAEEKREGESKQLEAKVSQLESSLSETKSAKDHLEQTMAAKCRDLEKKLDQANREKSDLYKQQMEKI